MTFFYMQRNFIQPLPQLMLRIRQRLNDDDDDNRDRRIRQLVKKPKISSKQWINMMRPTSSQSMKQHIVNFFLAEGHVDLATQFADEAGVQMPDIDEKRIIERQETVSLIKKGQIDEAIDKIETMEPTKSSVKIDPEREEAAHELIFTLKSLKVINLIKEKNIEKALQTARKQLLPFTLRDTNRYMPKIEEIMSLLVFPDMKQCTNYRLTTTEYRCEAANRVNQMLLDAERKNRQQAPGVQIEESSLVQLLKMGMWLEKRLEKHLLFPKVDYFSSERMYAFEKERKI